MRLAAVQSSQGSALGIGGWSASWDSSESPSRRLSAASSSSIFVNYSDPRETARERRAAERAIVHRSLDRRLDVDRRARVGRRRRRRIAQGPRRIRSPGDFSSSDSPGARARTAQLRPPRNYTAAFVRELAHVGRRRPRSSQRAARRTRSRAKSHTAGLASTLAKPRVAIARHDGPRRAQTR